jgi:hypothetical protein
LNGHKPDADHSYGSVCNANCLYLIVRVWFAGVVLVRTVLGLRYLDCLTRRLVWVRYVLNLQKDLVHVEETKLKKGFGKWLHQCGCQMA